jgi:hypothetical protein
MKLPKSKFILDACCGPRMMWVDKNHPNALYIDVRKEGKGFVESRDKREIKPDMIADFTNLPFDHKFKLIVWDPPHLIAKSMKGILTKTFGCLNAETWPKMFQDGFNELWDHLEDYGILVFKFNNYDVKFSKILKLFHTQPLIKNIVSNNKRSVTKWFLFMKIPKLSPCCNSEIEIHGEGITSQGEHYKMETCIQCGKEI